MDSSITQKLVNIGCNEDEAKSYAKVVHEQAVLLSGGYTNNYNSFVNAAISLMAEHVCPSLKALSDLMKPVYCIKPITKSNRIHSWNRKDRHNLPKHMRQLN